MDLSDSKCSDPASIEPKEQFCSSVFWVGFLVVNLNPVNSEVSIWKYIVAINNLGVKVGACLKSRCIEQHSISLHKSE